jgi:hypothetical protein
MAQFPQDSVSGVRARESAGGRHGLSSPSRGRLSETLDRRSRARVIGPRPARIRRSRFANLRCAPSSSQRVACGVTRRPPLSSQRRSRPDRGARRPRGCRRQSSSGARTRGRSWPRPLYLPDARPALRLGGGSRGHSWSATGHRRPRSTGGDRVIARIPGPRVPTGARHRGRSGERAAAGHRAGGRARRCTRPPSPGW